MMDRNYPENQSTGYAESAYTGTVGSAMRSSSSDTDLSIDLVELFYVYLEHLWQIALAVLLGAVLGFFVARFTTVPVYKATSQIYMVSASSNSVVNLSDISLGASLQNDYKILIKNRGLLEAVSENLGLGYSASLLSGMISISSPENTRLINITVTSTMPAQAADIANEVARQAIIFLPEIMECKPPHISELAIAPAGPSSGGYSRNVIVYALAFAVVYCGYLLVRLLLNDTFVSEEDVKKFLGEPPIGIIPEGDLGTFNKRRKKKSAKVSSSGSAKEA